MKMLTDFRKFIELNRLFNLEEKVLIAVSGGMDSVAMLDLFVSCNFNIGIIHCNFSLRGEESDEDELFVKNLALKYRLPFYSTKFQTEEYANSNGISIQMAARELRYNWFEEIREIQGFDYVAVAHNSDDIAETTLINFIRGTGVRGMCGIKPKNNKIIRPLLFASRKMIRMYIDTNRLIFREDSSNSDTKYVRNKIRHQIIPLINEINPDFLQTSVENSNRFRDVLTIYEDVVNEKSSSILSKTNDGTLEIDIEKLLLIEPMQTYLYEFLRPYSFNNDVVSDIVAALRASPGKRFFSETHCLLKDRSKLIVKPLIEKDDGPFLIMGNIHSIKAPIKMSFELIERKITKIPVESKIACIDADMIIYPMVLRRWEKGDIFMPLGMRGMKKLSDFFVDNKLSVFDKENIWVLEVDGKIAWIVGYRIDDRFKITPKTEKFLKISCVE